MALVWLCLTLLAGTCAGKGATAGQQDVLQETTIERSAAAAGPGRAATNRSATLHEFDEHADRTSNRVFNQVAGLTKVWAQSWAPIGRAIVPAIVPAGTRLYHGNSALPTAAESLAFEGEHSWLFGTIALEGKNTSLWTLSTRRDLKVLLFDGNSAAKSNLGQRHLQQLLIDGAPCDVPGKPTCPDNPMAERLCDLPLAAHVDGFIRQEASFELLACNFSDSSAYEVINQVPLSARYRSPRDIPPDNDPNRMSGLPYARSMFSSFYLAAMTHAEGDSRIVTLPEHLVTLYDEVDYPSLTRSNVRSIYHHAVNDISHRDVETFRVEVDQAIADWSESRASGVSWSATIQTVVDRYGPRLAELQLILSNATALEEDELGFVHRAVLSLHSMVFPYIDAPIVLQTWPHTSPNEAVIASLQESKEQCRMAYTFNGNAVLNKQEMRINKAIGAVLDRVCSVVIGVFGEALLAERAGALQTGVAARWKQKVAELMDWLAWPTFQRCERQCAWDEVCWHKAWFYTVRESVTPYDDIPAPKCVKLEDLLPMIHEGVVQDPDR